MERKPINYLILPPRTVPLLVRLKVLFGGFFNQFGWIFFGFGMIFFWIFVVNGDYSFILWQGEKAVTTGTITESHKTGFSVGGSDNSEGTPVYANHYRFKVASVEYTGVSYATGISLNVGQEVNIEYSAANPQKSRIEKMKRAPFGPWIAFVAIFPFIGLCFIWVGFKKGLKGNHLLVNGVIGEGTLVAKEATGTRINNRTVYKYTFEFKAEDGRTYKITGKTHLSELEDDAHEKLLYHPFDPSYGVMFDNLPGNPRIDDHGNIQCSSSFGTLLSLIIPGVSILGHGLWAVIYFGL